MRQRTLGKINGNLLASVLAVSAFLGGFGLFVLFDKSVLQPTELPEDYTYDISSLSVIAPEQILYQPAAEPTQVDLQFPIAIDIDAQKRIYAIGDQKLLILDPLGDEVREIELDAEPTCLEADGDRIYVGLTDHIVAVDSAGMVLQEWEAPDSEAWLTAIAVQGQDVFAADAKNKVIWHYDLDGNLIKSIGKKDAERNLPGFVIPSPTFDIAFAPDGLLRAINPGRHLVEAWTVDGDREWAWGKPGTGLEGFSGCCNPVALAVLPEGGFITAEKGLVRVKEYDAEGSYVGVVAGPDQLDWSQPALIEEEPQPGPARLIDVAADSDGRVYVLDCVRGIVHIFEKK